MSLDINLISTERNDSVFSVKSNFNENTPEHSAVSPVQKMGNKATMRRFKAEAKLSNIINSSSISKSAIIKIPNKLMNILSEAEFLYVAGKIQAGEKINSSLIHFLASVRGSNKSFSSKEIRDIADILSEFDVGSKMELNEEFWAKLQKSVFGSDEQYFREQNAQVNYEAKRIFSIFQSQKDLGLYLDPSFIRQMLVDGLITDESTKDRFWEDIFKTASIYGHTDKIFTEESWEENYEIAYCTQGMERVLAEADKGRFNAHDLENALNKFPKTYRLNITGFYYLLSPSIESAINRCSKYLKSFTCKWCGGRSDGEGLTDYYGIQQGSIDALFKCKELQFVDINVDPWCCSPPDRVRQQLQTNAPWITSLYVGGC